MATLEPLLYVHAYLTHKPYTAFSQDEMLSRGWQFSQTKNRPGLFALGVDAHVGHTLSHEGTKYF